MRCLIIEDEPEAINILTRYIDSIDDLELVASVRNPLKAYSILDSNDVDILFLDINMPDLSGISFLKSLPRKPFIVLTTAYSDYAVESYELNVTDYLLKPISIERFVTTINKIRQQKEIQIKPEEIIIKNQFVPEFVFLKSGTQTFKIKTDNILFIEKQSNYLCFQTTTKKILVRGNMSEIFGWIPKSIFLRVHKSFIVNINQIESIDNHEVTIGKFKIPFGEIYREESLKRIMQ